MSPAPLPPPWFYLRPDEQPLVRVGAAPGYAAAVFARLAVPLTVVGAVAVAAALVLERVPDEAAVWAAGAYAVALVLAALAGRARQRFAEYAVTDERVYARQGRLFTRVHVTTLDRITDMRYHQGPLDRLLGIGSLYVMTAGGDVALLGLDDALGARETIERARDAFVQRLLARAGVEAPRRDERDVATEAAEFAHDEAAEPAAPPLPEIPAHEGPAPDFVQPGDRVVWVAKPRPANAIGALRSAIGALPLVAFMYVSRGTEGAVGALMLIAVFSVVLVIARLAQQRRTTYVASDRRVYARSGLFGTTIAQLTYDKITDITYKQDAIGRLLGFASLTLSTAGGAPPVTFSGLADAPAAKETIERLRARYLREDRA